MKKKDITELVVALIVLAATLYLIYGLVGPKSSGGASAKGQTIVKVTPISPDFDSGALQSIGDTTQTKDFYTPPNLQSGLGNSQPFGQ
jgi:hypothetical protein